MKRAAYNGRMPSVLPPYGALLLSLLSCATHAQGNAVPGLQLMADRTGGNCVVCHTVPGVPGPASDFAPSLVGVGKRWNAEELRQWVTDARQIKPQTLMPPFGTTRHTTQPTRAAAMLTAEQIEHVVAALQTFQ